MAHTILRRRAVLARTGLSRSTLYDHISRGEFPPPIPLGGRAVGWPEAEIDAVIQARIAGRSDDEVRELVSQLIDSRRAAA